MNLSPIPISKQTDAQPGGDPWQRRFVASPPSQGIDKNWHVVDDADAMVAHCYGFMHDVEGGAWLARRIAACLNACRGIPTAVLERCEVGAC